VRAHRRSSLEAKPVFTILVVARAATTRRHTGARQY